MCCTGAKVTASVQPLLLLRFKELRVRRSRHACARKAAARRPEGRLRGEVLATLKYEKLHTNNGKEWEGKDGRRDLHLELGQEIDQVLLRSRPVHTQQTRTTHVLHLLVLDNACCHCPRACIAPARAWLDAAHEAAPPHVPLPASRWQSPQTPTPRSRGRSRRGGQHRCTLDGTLKGLLLPAHPRTAAAACDGSSRRRHAEKSCILLPIACSRLLCVLCSPMSLTLLLLSLETALSPPPKYGGFAN